MSNHLMPRLLKTVVVSDEEKAHLMCQVGTRKTSVSDTADEVVRPGDFGGYFAWMLVASLVDSW
jgi:hypothetical protein